MIILVTSDDLIQLFFGWEAIGACSFLLISFWFTWIEANKSAIKAMVVNRVGDFFLSASFFLLFFNFKTTNISSILSLLIDFQDFVYWPFNVRSIDLIAIFLIFGISAKSAQLPFHTWLVNAMSAPSPVSALIHAATLVTSGVFLIIKFSMLFEHSIFIEWLSLIGVLTAFFAAITGLVQNDFKRVIAYSTCSQLGYMVFSCGLSTYQISYFHLLNHGCFKALLFLGAGALIHSFANKQDIRFLGAIHLKLPLSYSFFIIGSLALTGFPFLSGFYSKDLIIEVSFANYHW
jgi:NADH-quinone oxidoreductase subunit L